MGGPPPLDAPFAGDRAADPQTVRPDVASGAAVQSEQPWGAQASDPDGLVSVVPVDFAVPPGFDIQARIRGPDNGYIAHIEQETGVNIEVVEGGGGPHAASAVEVHVATVDPWKRKAAEDLVQSLLETVRECANTWAGPPDHAVLRHVHQPLPGHYYAARSPLPQFQRAGESPRPPYDTSRDKLMHDGYVQPHAPPNVSMHQHAPPQGFVGHDREMERQHPPVVHETLPLYTHERVRVPPPGLQGAEFETTARAPHPTPSSTAQPHHPGAATSGGYSDEPHIAAAPHPSQEKPVKRKFREFKEEPGAAQAPPEKKSQVSIRLASAEAKRPLLHFLEFVNAVGVICGVDAALRRQSPGYALKLWSWCAGQ